MNLITTMILIVFTNYVITIITKYLPVERKKLWNTILISIADGGTILLSLIPIIDSLLIAGEQHKFVISLFESLGCIIGVIVGYLTSMMIVHEGYFIFKKKRSKLEKEKNKKGKTMPRYIFCLISLILAVILFGFGTLAIVNYDKKLLVSLVSAYTLGAVMVGISLYCLITGTSRIVKGPSGRRFMLLVELPDRTRVFTTDLSKGFNEKNAIGEFADTLLLDDYGYLITPNIRYYVKGVKVDSLDKSQLDSLKMTEDLRNFDEILPEFRRYEKHKIYISTEMKIQKNVIIK